MFPDSLKEAWVAASKELPWDTSQIADVIEKGVDSFMKTVPPLTKVLDGTHTGVVLPAFKAVYALEMTRREDAKRILARIRCSTAIGD